MNFTICIIFPEFDPLFDDSGQCWHGYGFKDCNKLIHIQPHGCKWYHFFPDEPFEEHVRKFNEITEDAYDMNMKSLYDSAKP